MKASVAVTSAALLLALTACGGGGDGAESAAPTVADTASGDTFEDIPDDAPIHDMDEDDLMQHFLECDDGLSAEECQQQHESGVEVESIERDIQACQEYIGEAEGGGWAVGSCSNYTMTNTEFYQVFEDRTGEPVPDDLREANPTCDKLTDELTEAVSDYNRDPQSASAEGAVAYAEDRVEMHDCEDEVSQNLESGQATPSDGALPSADEVDFYGPISHPDELMVDINTIEGCEDPNIIWGGLKNGELEGFDIDAQYMDELEVWMQDNGCW